MRFLVASGMAATVAGCSLLVSTSDLTSGALDAGGPGADVTTSSDAGASSSGSVEAGIEAGPDGGYVELPGLIGAWLFDDGTPNDSSGHDHHGTLSGDAKVVATDRGNAMRLSGDGLLRVESLENGAFPASGTLSVWFQWSNMPQAIEVGVFDSWDSTRPHIFARHVDGKPPGAIQIALQTSDEYELATGYDIGRDTWTHLVITWDASERYARVFADRKGILSDNYPSGSFVPSGQHVRVGARFDGFIDDIRLYDRAMTEAEALSLP